MINYVIYYHQILIQIFNYNSFFQYLIQTWLLLVCWTYVETLLLILPSGICNPVQIIWSLPTLSTVRSIDIQILTFIAIILQPKVMLSNFYSPLFTAVTFYMNNSIY